MFDAIIRASLRRPALVLLAAVLIVAAGLRSATTMPVDVLPELTAPTVTVVTEAQGLSPEEVEQIVTIPLEQALNGAQGVRRIRSSSAIGLSLVWVEFAWDVDPLVARQIVSERLRVAHGTRGEHPEPVLAPASSIMGEIMFVGLRGGDGVSPKRLRTVADWDVRRALLAVPGVAQVVPIGGEVAQIHITLEPAQLIRHQLTTANVADALRQASRAGSGSFHVAGSQEYLLRAYGRPSSLEDLGRTLVARRDGVPIMLRDVAQITTGAAIKRGDAAVDGQPAVVLKIQKQAGANTLDITRGIDAVLDDLEHRLPSGITVYRKGFRQAQFIRVAIDNVTRVLFEASVLVVVVLFMFLMSWRTTIISVIALPLSLLSGIIVLHLAGASINTMTLGGLAIAIGELVDDAIIDVENVHRRLRENATLPPGERRSVFDVVLDGSREIRGSIVFATAIIVLAFMPLFFLSGLEGRLLVPLGFAFVASIVASLFVALTVTPVLCLLLLNDDSGERVKQSKLAAWLEGRYRPMVAASLRRSTPIALVSVAGVAAAIAALLTFGRGFLPPFNEGALNIAAATAPGTSLATSSEVVARLEKGLLEHPAVTSVMRITGRAEQDEHALDVNYSELEVTLDVDSDRDAVLADVRRLATQTPGLAITVGQPISHRIEHMMSGVRASLAVKLYGNDLDTLRSLGRQAADSLRSVDGVVDVSLEQQTEVPHVVIRPRATELAALGRSPGQLIDFVQLALAGETVATWWDHERTMAVVARFPATYRDDLEQLRGLPVDGDGERFVSLESIADVTRTMGPNLINRENVERRMVVSANVAGRDIKGAADEVRSALRRDLAVPPGYRYALGGEFESEASASRTIVGLAILATVGMLLLLTSAFRSLRDAALVMVNMPFALVGGAIAVWLGGGTVTIASLVGFVTLFGIASRNGIMMVAGYRQLMAEGEPLERAVVEGSARRLVPILMTALTAALALIPIAAKAGAPGHEIQGPMALVILGGLLSATALNLVVVPTLFARFAGAPRPDASPSRSESA